MCLYRLLLNSVQRYEKIVIFANFVAKTFFCAKKFADFKKKSGGRARGWIVYQRNSDEINSLKKLLKD